jgi:Cu/Ag efflux protein CusF
MNPIRNVIRALVAVAAVAVAPQVLAAGNHGAHAAAAPAATPAADLAEGEVRKVDKDAAKVTVKHGEIKNLDMPAMTMVFSVKDKALLEGLKAGDKVKFKAVNDAGKFTVTDIRVSP